MKRGIAAAIAIIGWSTLGLRFFLTIEAAQAKGVPVGGAIIDYFSFFTILTNLLIALCLTLSAWNSDRDRPWNAPAAWTALAVYIIVVALVYRFILQDLSSPQGLNLLADRLLHRLLPALYVAYWFFATPKGFIRVTDPLLWLIYPLCYFGYTMLRGAYTGYYPYPFLDVGKQGYGVVLWNALLLFSLLLALSAGLGVLDRMIGRLLRRKPEGAIERLWRTRC